MIKTKQLTKLVVKRCFLIRLDNTIIVFWAVFIKQYFCFNFYKFRVLRCIVFSIVLNSISLKLCSLVHLNKFSYLHFNFFIKPLFYDDTLKAPKLPFEISLEMRCTVFSAFLHSITLKLRKIVSFNNFYKIKIPPKKQ